MQSQLERENLWALTKAFALATAVLAFLMYLNIHRAVDLQQRLTYESKARFKAESELNLLRAATPRRVRI